MANFVIHTGNQFVRFRRNAGAHTSIRLIPQNLRTSLPRIVAIRRDDAAL
jgi:hypothetical protein